MIGVDYSNNIRGFHPVVSHDDTTLVLAAKGGDQRAFVELFRRHSAQLMRVTHRITRNDSDAEDAMQDTFLKAYVHVDMFEGRSQFKSWLTRIAINSSFMILRRKKMRAEVSIDCPPDDNAPYGWQIIDASADFEAQYFRHEKELRLRQAVRKLPPILRDVLEIQQATHGSMKEIAEAAELTLSATKSRIVRAKAALRRSLSEDGRDASRRSSARYSPAHGHILTCEDGRRMTAISRLVNVTRRSICTLKSKERALRTPPTCSV